MPDVTAKGGVIRVVISRWRKMVRKPTRGNRQKKDGRHGGEICCEKIWAIGRIRGRRRIFRTTSGMCTEYKHAS